MFRSFFKLKQPRTRKRSLALSEYALAVGVGIVSGVYIFGEPLKQAATEIQKQEGKKQAD